MVNGNATKSDAGSLPETLYRQTASPAPVTNPLDGPAHADVCVIGAGFTGLSAALTLAERGAKVMVLEAREIGFGASGRNGGQVNPGLKLNPDQVERDFGPDLGSRMVAFAGAAPDHLFGLIERYGIACEAKRSGTLRAAVHPRHVAAVQETCRQLEARGAPVEFLGPAQVAGLTGTDRYQGAMLDHRGGSVNPMSLVRGIATAAIKMGVVVHENTRAKGLKRSGQSWAVMTAGGAVTAAQVVIATNGYSDDLWPGLRRSIVPVFGAIAASEPLPDKLAKGVMPGGQVLYESGTVTVYYRIDAARRLLIGGRGPLREVTATREISHLLRYADTLWPTIRGVAWTHAWGGQLAMTVDHYPHLHVPEPGIWICLGYNGRGVAMATALGAHLGRRLSAATEKPAMPITPIREIPAHRLWKLGVYAAITHGRVMDWLGA